MASHAGIIRLCGRKDKAGAFSASSLPGLTRQSVQSCIERRLSQGFRNSRCVLGCPGQARA